MPLTVESVLTDARVVGKKRMAARADPMENRKSQGAFSGFIT
jgi:hypothetical protein